MASNYAIRTLDPPQRPYFSTTVVPVVDTGLHDAEGVRLVLVNGKAWDHPVAQAQYAIALINSYNMTSDARYLARAKAQADRLIERATSSRGAIYFPYPFPWYRGTNDLMTAPWYSGMAQGQALTTFVRLYELTGSGKYRDAATLTYNSFLNLKSSTLPWVTLVDPGGHLWFDEYPKDIPDWTYNGFIFAAYGVYDYYRLTHSAGALRLLRGAVTTAGNWFSRFRVPGWISYYSLTHHAQNWFYHFVHLGQMQELYTITGSVGFARFADALFVDYADRRVNGTVHFSGGTHIGYQFDAIGAVIASRSYTLVRASHATASTRESIRGHSGAWLKISDGIWAGYWIQEKPNSAFLQGLQARSVRYDPPRHVSFAGGTYTGYTFNSAGAVVSHKAATLSRSSPAATNMRGIINGTTYLRISSGIWAGYWIKLGGGLTY